MAIWRRGLWSASAVRPTNDLLADAVDTAGRCACCRMWWRRDVFGARRAALAMRRRTGRLGRATDVDAWASRARCSWHASAGWRGADGAPARQGQQDRQGLATVAARESGWLRHWRRVDAIVVGLPSTRRGECIMKAARPRPARDAGDHGTPAKAAAAPRSPLRRRASRPESARARELRLKLEEAVTAQDLAKVAILSVGIPRSRQRVAAPSQNNCGRIQAAWWKNFGRSKKKCVGCCATRRQCTGRKQERVGRPNAAPPPMTRCKIF